MRRSLFVGALVVCLARLAVAADQHAADDAHCVSGEPAPVLNATSPRVHSHTFTITGPRTAEESAVIEPDLRVHIARAGCAHFSLVYSFDAAVEHPVTDSQAWLRVASGLMRRVSQAETAGFASTLAAALEKQALAGRYTMGDEIAITQGYASASLDLVAGDEGKVTIRVTYGVVL